MQISLEIPQSIFEQRHHYSPYFYRFSFHDISIYYANKMFSISLDNLNRIQTSKTLHRGISLS